MSQSSDTRNLATFVVLALLFASVTASPAASQKPAASHSTKSVTPPAFEPLERWKQAVLSGDRTTLVALYSTLPGVMHQTPRGPFSDPGEEEQYWAGLRGAGLESINPKILQMDTRQPGATILTLRIDVTLRSSGHEQDFIISGVQIWVQQGGGWQIYRSKRSDLLPRPAMRLPEPARPNPQLYPDPAEARKDLDAALAAARADHKNVLVVFGGNWCYDCHVLDSAFHSKELAPLIAANFHVVHVNIAEYNANQDIAQQCQVVLDKGVPALAVLDAGGRVLVGQRNGEFESAVRIGPADVRQFLEQWKPTGTR